MRYLVRYSVASLALFATAGQVSAQSPAYPSKPVHIIIPAGAGGAVAGVGMALVLAGAGADVVPAAGPVVVPAVQPEAGMAASRRAAHSRAVRRFIP